MKYIHSFLIVVALFVVSNAHADDAIRNYNQISLEVSSSADVENDIMIISLYALEEGSKPVDLANRVNKKINWALEKLKQYDSIKVETESYSTSPVYSKNQIVAWRVRQSIQLESKDMPLMTQVLAELQQQLKLSGLSFDVSRDKREQQVQLLIDQALTAYKQRATQIANKLQSDTYKIVNMNVSTSDNVGQYKHRVASAMLADAEMAQAIAPEVARGDQTLTVRVSGTIELE